VEKDYSTLKKVKKARSVSLEDYKGLKSKKNTQLLVKEHRKELDGMKAEYDKTRKKVR